MPLLSELSDWRRRLDEIQSSVYTSTNDTDVVFVADFPGQPLSPSSCTTKLSLLIGPIKRFREIRFCIFCRTMLCIRAAYDVTWCLSVRPYASRSCILVETNKRSFIIFTAGQPHHSSFSIPNVIEIFRRGPPKWRKIAIFDQCQALASITAGPSRVFNISTVGLQVIALRALIDCSIVRCKCNCVIITTGLTFEMFVQEELTDTWLEILDGEVELLLENGSVYQLKPGNTVPV